MDQSDRDTSDPGGGPESNSVLRRLGDSRWTLAAAATAIALVSGYGLAPVYVPILGIALVAAAAAFAPRRTRQQRRADRVAQAEPPGIGRLRATNLAEAVPEPLIVFDSGGGVMHANAAAIAAFGALPRGAALQLRFRAPEMQDLIATVLEERRSVAEIEYSEKVPVERLFLVGAVPIGEEDQFVLVFRDQSEVRRIERMRADFIANASHELRTPLASIAGFIETLRGPARNDEQARENFLQIMQDQTSRMARLIDDLLSLSRIETKAFLKPDETADLRQILDGVIDSLNYLARENGVVIERAFCDGPVIVPGNGDELIQVFENLLENACKYGHSGGRVAVEMARTPDNPEHDVAVTIRDFGAGIPEEHIPRVTERFYRVDVETSRAQKGTGLGLSIVKHILGRHDGRLSIRSTAGEGSAFTVHLRTKTPAT